MHKPRRKYHHGGSQKKQHNNLITKNSLLVNWDTWHQNKNQFRQSWTTQGINHNSNWIKQLVLKINQYGFNLFQISWESITTMGLQGKIQYSQHLTENTSTDINSYMYMYIHVTYSFAFIQRDCKWWSRLWRWLVQKIIQYRTKNTILRSQIKTKHVYLKLV